MSMIRVTLPAGEIPVDGKQVSFVAPCNSLTAEGIQIDGEAYIIVDAIGKTVTGKGGVWYTGAIVSVILDVTNKKAYLQSSNVGALMQIITAKIPASGWSSSQTNGYYTNRVTVSGMLASYNPFCDLIVTSATLAEAEREAMGKIIEIETFDGYVIARALEAPTTNINVRFMGV